MSFCGEMDSMPSCIRVSLRINAKCRPIRNGLGGIPKTARGLIKDIHSKESQKPVG